MPLFHIDFFSDTLGMCVNADVIIPKSSRSLIGMTTKESESYKTLYLLHGLSDDHTIWQRRTSIERYAAGKGIAVVMPCAHRSWYTDMAHGGKYYTYISKELPAFCQSVFRGMSSAKEDNYIAGLSMGGYGAVKIALNNPDSFAAVASFSGALDVYTRCANDKSGYYNDIFGSSEAIIGSMNDVYSLAEKLPKEKQLPVYMWCGTEDRLLSENRRFCELLTKLGFDVDYNESSGNHSWPYWDIQIQKVLDKWF